MRKGFFFLLSFCILLSSTSYSAATLTVPATGTNPTPEEIRAAVSALVAMPKKERKQKLKEAKKIIKAYKAAKKAGEEPDTNTILLVILAILLPPLAVYLHQGETNSKFWITTLLFALGIIGAFAIGWYLWFAAVIYALIVILGNN